MAFPAHPIIDTFDRTEDPLANGWGSTNVAGTQLLTDGSRAYGRDGIECMSWWTASGDWADQEIYARVQKMPGPGTQLGLFARGNRKSAAEVSGYGLFLNPNGTLDLYKPVNAVYGAAVVNLAVNVPVNGGFGLRCQGSQIEVWIDTGSGWTLMYEYTDSTHSTGYVGMYTYNGPTSGGAFDSIGAGAFGALLAKDSDEFKLASRTTL